MPTRRASWERDWAGDAEAKGAGPWDVRAHLNIRAFPPFHPEAEVHEAEAGNPASQVIHQLTGSGRAGARARTSTRRGSSPGCRPKIASKSFPRECKSWKKRAASLGGLAGRRELRMRSCHLPGLPGSNLGPTAGSAGGNQCTHRLPSRLLTLAHMSGNEAPGPLGRADPLA